MSIEIEAPRGPVVALFREAENWPRWQESLLRWESVRGRPDETGALTKLVHRFGGRDVEMLETVDSNRLPDELICTYEAPSAWNRVTYGFGDAGPQKTLWRFDSEFRCRGTVYILALIAPRFFRSASLKEMTSFKKFAESELSEYAT